MTILRHGISGRVIDPLSEYLDVGKGELAVMLDLDRTTAQRRAGRNEPLPMHSAESVLRLLELEDMANATFESEEAALQWLRRPHPMLDNDSPLEAAKTSFGARRVKDIMVSVKYGGVV
jgi:putative toxin-antitoxin system antitoxin component (TIGR02293 family)